MLRRLLDLIIRPIANPEVEAWYRACVAQARDPFFYTDFAIPDTVDGRFDLLILHVLLVIERMKRYSSETQQLFDILFADMDKNLREMGVSDVSIAKKMKPMLAAFYGRAKVYENALQGSDADLGGALEKNIYGGKIPTSEVVLRLTKYVRLTVECLMTQEDADLLSGSLSFLSPKTA